MTFASSSSEMLQAVSAMALPDSSFQISTYAEPARVLVADDQPDVLEALRILLKSAGYGLTLAATPRAVIEQLQRSTFDAIIMDLNYTMDTTSGREGMDLLAAVKAVDATLPVIVMTAWATVDLAVEALRRGAADFIQKPWDNTQVLNTVQAHVARRRLLARELRSRQRELQDAQSVQRALLPADLPQVAGCELAAWTRPARAIGGDYYDVILLDENRAAFIIADVCGKGVPAALTMSNLHGAVRTLIWKEASPANLCRNLNRFLHATLTDGRFVSLFCGFLDTRWGRFQFCNAGHQPPLAVTGNGVARLDAGGAVLGYFEDWAYEDGQVTLDGGDSLLLFTDGVVDARNRAGAEFDESGISASVPTNAGRADSIRDAITHAVREHCEDAFEDDATLVVVRRAG